MDAMLNLIEQVFNWWVNSGLCEKTAYAFADIVNYIAIVIIPLMYEYLNNIFMR